MEAGGRAEERSARRQGSIEMIRHCSAMSCPYHDGVRTAAVPFHLE